MQPTYRWRRDPGTHGVPFCSDLRFLWPLWPKRAFALAQGPFACIDCTASSMVA